MKDALDVAAVLAQNVEREPLAREVVEYPGVAARDVHAAADLGEVNVDVAGELLAAPAEDDGVGLHVVLEVFALELGEAHGLLLAAANLHHGAITHCSLRYLGN